MNARLLERQVIPFRWVGHRLDIRAVRQEGVDPVFAAHDVEVALGLMEPADALAIEHSIAHHADQAMSELRDLALWRAGVHTASGELMPLYAIDTVIRLARAEPTASAARFIPWFHELVDMLTLEDLTDDDVAPAPHEVAEVLAADSVWTIAEAARILAADPALRAFGRDTLFQALRRTLGWIARDAGVWVPSASAEFDGYLQRYRVRDETRRVDSGRVTYPQIRVTTSGLRELHRLLGGVAELALPAEPQPNLLEGL